MPKKMSAEVFLFLTSVSNVRNFGPNMRQVTTCKCSFPIKSTDLTSMNYIFDRADFKSIKAKLLRQRGRVTVSRAGFVSEGEHEQEQRDLRETRATPTVVAGWAPV